MTIRIKDNAVVLFQGDSITDADRARDVPDSLGCGYAAVTAALLGVSYPERRITFVNRGLNGNRISDIRARAQKDILDIKPDVLSILVGINDARRMDDKYDPTPAELFEKDYRELLKEVTGALNCKILLMEPFVLPVTEYRAGHRQALEADIGVVRKLAKEFNTELIPLDGIITGAAVKTGPAFWSPDGIHPSMAGHGLIAKSWIEHIT